MGQKTIVPIQADIIFKALYYVASNEGLEIPNELTEIYKVLAEIDPCDTHAEDTIGVMESLSEFIKNNPKYQPFFLEEEMENE